MAYPSSGETQRLLEPHPTTQPFPPIWRRLFHLTACGSIPFVGIFASASVMVTLMAALSGVALASELARFRLPKLNSLLVRMIRPLLKSSEDRKPTGATYIAIAALAAFLLFDKPIAITALFFLAFGDPVAALVGSRVGGVRVLSKSPWGSLAFVLVGLATVGVLSGTGAVSYHWALLVGAAIAALVELAPLPLDDNLTIPLISGAAMDLMVVL